MASGIRAGNVYDYYSNIGKCEQRHWQPETKGTSPPSARFVPRLTVILAVLITLAIFFARPNSVIGYLALLCAPPCLCLICFYIMTAYFGASEVYRVAHEITALIFNSWKQSQRVTMLASVALLCIGPLLDFFMDWPPTSNGLWKALGLLLGIGFINWVLIWPVTLVRSWLSNIKPQSGSLQALKHAIRTFLWLCYAPPAITKLILHFVLVFYGVGDLIELWCKTMSMPDREYHSFFSTWHRAETGHWTDYCRHWSHGS